MPVVVEDTLVVLGAMLYRRFLGRARSGCRRYGCVGVDVVRGAGGQKRSTGAATDDERGDHGARERAATATGGALCWWRDDGRRGGNVPSRGRGGKRGVSSRGRHQQLDDLAIDRSHLGGGAELHDRGEGPLGAIPANGCGTARRALLEVRLERALTGPAELAIGSSRQLRRSI
jgi:hypothetical protein